MINTACCIYKQERLGESNDKEEIQTALFVGILGRFPLTAFFKVFPEKVEAVKCSRPESVELRRYLL